MSQVAQHPHLRQRIAAVSTSTEFARHFRPTVATPRAHTPRSEPVDPGLVTLLQTAAEWRCRLHAALREAGLSWPEYSVLRRLAEDGISPTAGELSVASSHAEACTAATLDGLTARALIEWQPVRPGESVPRVRLTSAGGERLAEGARVVDAVSAKFAVAIPELGRTPLYRFASRLAGVARGLGPLTETASSR